MSKSARTILVHVSCVFCRQAFSLRWFEAHQCPRRKSPKTA